jgi:hypothetical protein
MIPVVCAVGQVLAQSMQVDFANNFLVVAAGHYDRITASLPYGQGWSEGTS